MTNNQDTFRLAPDVVLQVIDGEALMLKLQDEVVFSLNETGARIAQLISEGQQIGAIVDILSREYGQSRDDIDREVNRLVQALQARNLLVAARTREIE